jgi:hypothetical protein
VGSILSAIYFYLISSVRAEVHGVDFREVGVDVERRRRRLPDVPQLDLALVRGGQVLAGGALPADLGLMLRKPF